MNFMISCCRKTALALLLLLVLPFYFVLIALWIVTTVSLIGPLLQCCYAWRDQKQVLDREKIEQVLGEGTMWITIPAGVNQASGDKSYTLFVRWVVPSGYDPTLPPLILPNGLAATAAFWFQIQDQLKERGYRSLNYDRLGVGLSDQHMGKSASAIDVARELDFIMTYISALPNSSLAANDKWLALNGSMGNIVFLAFCSVYPGRFMGFINVDGLPYGWVKSSWQYLNLYAPIYRMEASIVFTGIIRFFLSFMGSFFTSNFGAKYAPIIRAQLNCSRFFRSTYYEFFTMLSCCELVEAAMGELSVFRYDPQAANLLSNAKPFESYVLDATQGPRVTTDRSPSERGDSWSDQHQVDQTIAALRAVQADLSEAPLAIEALDVCLSDRGQFAVGTRAGGASAAQSVYPLAPQLKNMFVRSISMRSHNLLGLTEMNDMAYTKNQRVWAAFEHTFLVALGRLDSVGSKRIVYPHLTHAALINTSVWEQIFVDIDELAGISIITDVESRQGRSSRSTSQSKATEEKSLMVPLLDA